MIFELNELNLLEHVIPELVPMFTCYQTNKFHLQTVSEHTKKALTSSKNDKVLRWAVLFHDIGKPTQMTIDEKGITHFYGHEKISANLALEIMNRLRFDNLTSQRVIKLILFHDLKIEISEKVEISEKNIRRAVLKIGEELFPDYLEIKKADISGQNATYAIERLKTIKEIERIWLELKEKNNCLSLKNLAINGKDLLALGFIAGPEIGAILSKLLELVIEEPNINKKDLLLEKAKSLMIKLF